jgi:hypothetical protein
MRHKWFIGKAGAGKTTQLIQLAAKNGGVTIDHTGFGEIPAQSVSIYEAVQIALRDEETTIYIDNILFLCRDETMGDLRQLVSALAECKNCKLIASSQYEHHMLNNLLRPIISDIEVIHLCRENDSFYQVMYSQRQSGSYRQK